MLSGADFIHLLLQHVVPKGFRWARNYGFVHPNKKRLIALLHLVLRITPRPPPPDKPRLVFACPCGGSPMKILQRKIRPKTTPPPAAVQATERVV
ncbi:MAG: transposase [Rhodanobacter sp.]|jgi:hypothetical protein|nr:transposase [Rhodanobacter sp.]